MMEMNPAPIIKTATAFYDSCVLFAALEVGIFRLLAEIGPADVETVAQRLKLDPRGARLLLNACTALGLLVKERATYRNSPETTAFLVPGSPADLSRAIQYNRDVYHAWGRLAEMVRTGKPVEKPAIHLGHNPERTRAFVMAMHARALWMGPAVVPHLDTRNARLLLDVGGGPGTFSVLLAQANPHLRCIVLDLPEIVAVAQELIEQQAMTARVATLAGDYHSMPFPREVDIVNFLGVLHQESPAAIRSLFQKAFEALRPGGRVNVLDMMTDATHTQPRFSALFALNMALTTEYGWVFSDAELRQWLVEAGFTNFSVRPLEEPIPHWLATAHKPDAQQGAHSEAP